jgi:hypothetical protein
MANDPSGLGALGALLGAIARDERIKKEQDAARQAELEQQRRTVEQARLAQLESDRRAAETKAREQAALDRLPEFGTTCAELGFKRGSTPFSDCVIELYKRAKTR